MNMDTPPGTSSVAHHYYHESKKRDNNNVKHHRKRNHRSRSRSSSVESKSRRAYINPSPKFNFFNNGLITPSEYDVKIQAMSTQLSMAQNQISGLEHQCYQVRQHAGQLEQRLYTAQHENNNMLAKNTEMMSIIKTLEAGVEKLQKERTELKFERDDMKIENDKLQKQHINTTDQVNYLNERNSTLSKKCVELLESGKSNKEKLEKYETELVRLRPHAESMESRLKDIEGSLKSAMTRITTFEARERLWISEKMTMEQRVKELLTNEKRLQDELRQAKAAANSAVALHHSMPENLNCEGVEVEHLKALSSVIDSLRAHHQTELNRTRSRIDQIAHRRGRLSL